MTQQRRAARGVTLLELLIVLMILSLILTAAVKTWDVTLERGRFEDTRRRLNQIATAIVGEPNYIVAGRRADFGFVGDMGRLPLNLQELVTPPQIVPPESSRWRGPYLRSPFSESERGFRTDGWGDSIVYGYTVYNTYDSLFVRSYGGRGYTDRSRWLTRYFGYTRRQLVFNTVSGQVWDIREAPPQYPAIASRITAWLVRPFEGKLMTYPITVPANGQFSTIPDIPQGTHLLVVNYAGPTDTARTETDVTVYPGIGARNVQVRLNIDWNNEPH